MSGRRRLRWPNWSRRLTAGGYFLAINWLMLAPSADFGDIPDLVPHQDKIVHGSLFLTLALLVRWSLSGPGRTGRRRFGVFAALLLYAGSIEALQPVIGGAGRQFDWLDMASNFVGAGLGWLLYGMVGDGPAGGYMMTGEGAAGGVRDDG